MILRATVSSCGYTVDFKLTRWISKDCVALGTMSDTRVICFKKWGNMSESVVMAKIFMLIRIKLFISEW